MTTIDRRARAAIRTLPTYQPGKPIEEVKRELKLNSVVKLASNENALGASPKAVAALRRALGALHRYPDATCFELKRRLAKRFRLTPDSFLIGNGSDELIVLALRAFVDPGDEVVVANPTFLIYELQAKACGASVVTVPLRDFRYDLAAMKRAVTPHTKLVFIANPDNPTGTYVTRRELETFFEGIPSQAIVFLDEAYYEFVEANDYPQSVRYLTDRSLIITRSFSKTYGLAGLRVGYGIAHPSIIQALEAIREPFNVNALAQAAASAALDDGTFVTRTRAMIRAGRRYLEGELDRLRLRYIPSVTNFLLVKLGPRANTVANRLLKRGVIVREMSAWKLNGFIRVTIGTMPENRKFIQALKRVLGD